MKILHAIPSLKVGGAEKIVANLCGALADRGHNVTILLFEPLCKNSFCLHRRINIRVVSSFLSFKYNLFSLTRVLWYLRKEKFDVVHTHLTVNNTLVRFLAVFAGVPVIIGHEHGGFLLRNKIARFLLILLEKRITYNLFISEHDLEYFTSYDKTTSADKNLVVDNPLMVNIKPYCYKSNRQIEVIGMVGRIIGIKNHLWALQALSPFLRQNRCKIIIVGDGEESLKKEILQTALNNCIDLEITGYVQNVEKYLSAFDVLIHPSSTEGFGLAIIEAMAFGVPVIASKVGGIPNIIQHKINGLLFESGNESDLLNNLVQLNNDYSFRKNISKEAYNSVVDKFSFDRYIVKIEKLYENSLQKRS
jgi:glycosyltransferase involved in cell wall biosynthesis